MRVAATSAVSLLKCCFASVSFVGGCEMLPATTEASRPGNQMLPELASYADAVIDQVGVGLHLEDFREYSISISWSYNVFAHPSAELFECGVVLLPALRTCCLTWTSPHSALGAS